MFPKQLVIAVHTQIGSFLKRFDDDNNNNNDG